MFRRVKNERLAHDKGIKGYSPLLDLLNDFNIVTDAGPDEFHLIREGLTKAILKCLNLGTSRKYTRVWAAFDEIFTNTRVFSETPWRSRSLQDISYFKGLYLGVTFFQPVTNILLFLAGSEYGGIHLSERPAL